MKRVLRSCLDPLPRFLSTRGLVLVVGFVVVGTALSVFEYLESGRPPDTAWPTAEGACPVAPGTITPRAAPSECRPTASCVEERVYPRASCTQAARVEGEEPAAVFQPGSEATPTGS